ncbi:MAG: 4Fe-4S dicluster domain-containing protein, partial [Nitrospinota bacterium]
MDEAVKFAGEEPEVTSWSVVDVGDFNERVVGAYNEGTGENLLPADLCTARSVVPAGTAALRDFSYIAPDIPEFIAGNCIACMDCVVECPDTAILAKVIGRSGLDRELEKVSDPDLREHLNRQFAETAKFTKAYEKKGEEGGLFGIFIDPTKCKGCAECVQVCDDNALAMIHKTPDLMQQQNNSFAFYKEIPQTPDKYINERLLTDMMLAERSLLYVGGAGSCMGCGEATAIRMMLAATGFVYGSDSLGIVASTGCNTVYTSTSP